MSARNDISTVWRDIFAVAFQKSPIYLTGGIVKDWGNDAVNWIQNQFKNNLPAAHPIGDRFPVPLATLIADGLGVAVSDTASGFNAIGGNFALGTDSLDDLMLDFTPLAKSGTLFDTTPPSDPQTNAQAQDDNQLIKPSSISLQMSVPPHTVGHYATMLGLIPLMRAVFSQHKCLGGRYVVATPSYIWTNMVFKTFSDITDDPAQAPGSLFQLDFVQSVQKPQSTTEQKKSQTIINIDGGKIFSPPSSILFFGKPI